MSSKFALSMLDYDEMDLENCRILMEQGKLYNLIVYHAQQVVEKHFLLTKRKRLVITMIQKTFVKKLKKS